MNRESLKALTNAHAWLGLIMSTVLFIIFFAGSISLFRDNIEAWEKNPHFYQTADSQHFRIDKVLAKISQEYTIDMHGGVFFNLPSAEQPIGNLYFEEVVGKDDQLDKHLLVAADGRIIGSGDGFDWANFLYRLHYDLHIPEIGLYVVGLITLFFFVALLSGVVIHWRKIVNKFFQYRKDGKKDKLLDAHNLIGVMGLPFHIMYAFSGLVFNLIIVYQISYAMILFGGDQNKLFAAAGVVDIHVEETNVSVLVQGVDALFKKATASLGEVDISRLSIDHFGDESASVTFRGQDHSQFSTRKEVSYHIASGKELYLTKNNYDNDLRGGLSVIANLHFGNFAGFSLRILFFILGIGTCYIILTGNLMWLQKKEKLRSKKQNKRGIQLVRAMTTGGFIGTVFATAIGFIGARIFPADLVGRSEIISQAFFSCLVLALIASYFIKNQQRFAAMFLKLTAMALALTPLLDWLLLSAAIKAMLTAGHYDVVIVELCLLTLALCCWLVSAKLDIVSENIAVKEVSDNPAMPDLIAS